MPKAIRYEVDTTSFDTKQANDFYYLRKLCENCGQENIKVYEYTSSVEIDNIGSGIIRDHHSSGNKSKVSLLMIEGKDPKFEIFKDGKKLNAEGPILKSRAKSEAPVLKRSDSMVDAVKPIISSSAVPLVIESAPAKPALSPTEEYLAAAASVAGKMVKNVLNLGGGSCSDPTESLVDGREVRTQSNASFDTRIGGSSTDLDSVKTGIANVAEQLREAAPKKLDPVKDALSKIVFTAKSTRPFYASRVLSI